MYSSVIGRPTASVSAQPISTHFRASSYSAGMPSTPESKYRRVFDDDHARTCGPHTDHSSPGPTGKRYAGCVVQPGTKHFRGSVVGGIPTQPNNWVL